MFKVGRSSEPSLGTTMGAAPPGQPATGTRGSVAVLLPARHPRLLDTAFFLAIMSSICYFRFSDGVRGFGRFLVKILRVSCTYKMDPWRQPKHSLLLSSSC
jgi:hypothetical protein